MRVKTEKERIFRAVDEVIGDGMLEVPVPDMSWETIYDDEPKTEKEVEAHRECGEIRKTAWKEIQQLIEMSVGVLLDESQTKVVEKDKQVQVCEVRWCTSANMKFRLLMGRSTS